MRVPASCCARNASRSAEVMSPVAPVLFEGDRSAKAIKKFLRKNAHNPLPESKKKAEKEAKKGEL